jgi:two-component system OmpR family response regulator
MTIQHILIVDDDRDFAHSAKDFLQARGYQVALAHNSAAAQKALEQQRPDLIVLDIMMDYDAEGFNWAYKLKTAEETKWLPIIIVSGFEKHLSRKYDSFAFIEGREWPAAQMFQKPVQLSELATAIGAILAEIESRAPQAKSA